MSSLKPRRPKRRCESVVKPLREIQEAFAAAIFEGQKSPDKLQQFANLVHSNARLDAVGRIQVYAGSHQANITEALAVTYVVCQKIVGVDNFRYLAENYIARYPSMQQNLNYYGDKLGDLIATLPEIQKDIANMPYLPDLARLEWAYDQLILAADDCCNSVDLAALATIPAEKQGDIVFKLSQSATLLQSEHNIFDIWLKHSPELAETQPIGGSGPQFLFLHRDDFTRLVEVVGAAEYKFLQALQSAKPFSEVCDGLDLQQVDVSVLLPEAVRRRWIVDFELA